jgi:pimeloyl-ACP methyl ester carboxylesterase
MAPIELQVSGGTLHGQRRDSRYADAPILVALHAGVTDSRSWTTMFDLLEGMPTLVAYDRRGYGASPLPDAEYNSLDDLVQVLTQVAPAGAWLLGNSIGGRLALDLAVSRPDLVAGLILLSPGVSGAPEQEFDETSAQLFEVDVKAFEAGDLEQVAAIEAKLWLDGPAAAEGRAIADRIPGARFAELEDVAHLPSLEAPERVAELVRRAVLAP